MDNLNIIVLDAKTLGEDNLNWEIFEKLGKLHI